MAADIAVEWRRKKWSGEGKRGIPFSQLAEAPTRRHTPLPIAPAPDCSRKKKRGRRRHELRGWKKEKKKKKERKERGRRSKLRKKFLKNK